MSGFFPVGICKIWFWSKLSQFLSNVFYLELGEFSKKSPIIAIWVRWSEAVDVRLTDIMFEVKVTLQKTLSIKVELKSLVDCNMRGDKKLDDSLSTKLLAGGDVSFFADQC